METRPKKVYEIFGSPAEACSLQPPPQTHTKEGKSGIDEEETNAEANAG